MYCKCSLNNNYEIIGLCDIDEFNEKVSAFNENSWAQINLSDTLYLKDSNPNITDILEVYIKIKIDSNKIINTPHSTIPNFEGHILTSKSLSVHGHISLKIIYKSDSIPNSVHSYSLVEEFNTTINLSSDVDPETDKFCVYPCIENLFVRPIDERSIIKNLNLFLFAHEITANLPPVPKFLPNTIIVNSINNEEVLFIDFNISTKKLLVNSTGVIPNPQSTAPFLIFDIYDNFGNFINQAVILGNETGDKFSVDLNDTVFKYGGSISLSYLDNQRIIIKNYPTSQTPKYNPRPSSEKFTITPNGLAPYIYPNSIIVNNDSENMSKISFDFNPTSLSVISTDKIAPREFNGNEYLSFKLMTPNLNISNGASIMRNENAEEFSRTLDNTPFNTGQIIKLRYKKNANIVIKNYNNELEYKPKGNFEFFRIGTNSLIDFQPTLFFNVISLKNSQGDFILRISFISNLRKLIFDSKGINADSTFIFKTFDNIGVQQKLIGTLNQGQNPDSLLDDLDNASFDFNDILELSYTNNNLVEITNFPNPQTPIYKPKFSSQKFLITPTGLVEIPFSYLNEIIMQVSSVPLGNIQFNLNERSLVVSSTGRNMPSGNRNEEYLSFILMDSNFLPKAQGSVNGSSNADNFKTILNTKSIQNGDIIKLRYKTQGYIISRYKGSRFYLPTGNFEFIRITPDRLSPVNPRFFSNIIKLTNRDDSLVLSISFIAQPKVLVISPTRITNQDSTFTFKLFDKTQKLKKSKIITPNQSGDVMLELDNFPFDVDDIIELNYSNNTLVEITNFPNQGGPPYNPKGNSERFTIFPDRLVPYVYPNRIVIKNDQDLMAGISFDYNNLQLLANGTSFTTPPGFDNEEYLGFVLLDSNFIPSVKTSIIGGRTSQTLVGQLNNRAFRPNGIIKLRYKKTKNTIIKNFNGQSDYNPVGTYGFFEYYLITKYNLQVFNIEPSDTSIVLRDTSRRIVLYILLIKNTGFIVLDSTGVRSESNFTFKLLSKTQSEKISRTISNGQNADVMLPLDNFSFEEDDIVELSYSNNTLVEITNFPTPSTPKYTPTGTSERFTIIQNKLSPYVYPNTIKINNYQNLMANIFIDYDNLSLVATSTNMPAPSNFDDQEYLGFVLMDDEFTKIIESSIYGNETANNFVEDLRDEDFEEGYIIKLRYRVADNIAITNYNGMAEYHPQSTYGLFEYFTITKYSLEKLDIAPGINTIALKNLDMKIVFYMQFNDHQFIVLDSGGAVNRDSTFTFKLSGPSGREKVNALFAKNQNADNNLTKLDNFKFEYNDVIEIGYTNNTLVEITNFPNIGQTYNPKGTKESYIITEDGFVLKQ